MLAWLHVSPALARAQEGAEQEHIDTLQRKAIIEKKKEAASEALARKQREEEARKRIRAQQQAEAESERLREQNRARDLKRVKDEQARIRKQEIEKQLNDLKGAVKVDVESLGIPIEDIDQNTVRMIKLNQLETEKREKDNKVRITAKRIDHLERAFRREEVKHLAKDYEDQRQEDIKVYEQTKEETLKDAKMKHKEGLELKHRLGRLVKPYDAFKGDITARRAQDFERLRRKAEKELEDEKRKRIKAHQDEKVRKRQAEEAAERQRVEEEEKRIREEEEKAAAEAAKEREKAERKERLEKQRAEADAVARKQMEREEEAMRKRQEAKAAGGAPSREFSRPQAAPMEARTDSNEGGARPKLNLPGRSGGGWRERLAAKEAGGGGAAAAEPAAVAARSPSPAEPAAPVRSGYVPPHLRGQGAARPERPESPANGASTGRHVPQHMRDGGRSTSREDARSPAPEEPRKPAGSTGGRYVPPSMRNRG